MLDIRSLETGSSELTPLFPSSNRPKGGGARCGIGFPLRRLEGGW